MILVISSAKDVHATEVMARLDAGKAPVHLLDLSAFPKESSISLTFAPTGGAGWVFQNGGESLDLAECRAIWWRRPQPFQLHDDIQSNTDRNFAFGECHAAISGMWLSLDAFWINHPTWDEEAAKKVHQLKVAQRLGFRIPDTCITNDPERAQAFIAKRGRENVVYKAFSGNEQAWRETRILKEKELELIQSVRYAPVIFQEYIPVEADLRITVIDDQIFAGAIYTGSTSYEVDFRMAMGEAEMAAFDVPKPLVRQLVDYVRRLRLTYGAIDMRLTPNGDYVFLEINPSGQWLFVEQRTGLPITDALAGLLMRKERLHR